MKIMTYEEFKALCKERTEIDAEWNQQKFKIICQKCTSERTGIIIEGKTYAAGSTQTGSWTTGEGGILVKCYDCGAVMILGDVDEKDLEDVR